MKTVCTCTRTLSSFLSHYLSIFIYLSDLSREPHDIEVVTTAIKQRNQSKVIKNSPTLTGHNSKMLLTHGCMSIQKLIMSHIHNSHRGQVLHSTTFTFDFTLCY